MGIRLVVVDDNPHVAFGGRVHPVNATFQRFVAGLLDLPGSPVASIAACVPVREAAEQPATLPLDPRVGVVPTAPFDGIAGYLRAAPSILRANRPRLRAALAEADLLWLKVPASNAALAAMLAATAGVPRFVWVAGSATDVARARFGGGRRLAGILVGAWYDGIGRVAAAGEDRVVVGEGLVGPDGTPGHGLVTSLVEPDEIRTPVPGPWPAIPWRLRIAWAGRLAPGKGVEELLDAIHPIEVAWGPDRRVELVLLGDGPGRPALEARAAAQGIAERVHWVGYVADRGDYLRALAAADLFVHPSAAEGFPKVVLDAMAAGLPVVARPAGQLAPLAAAGLIAPVGWGGVARAVGSLLGEPDRARGLRDRGRAFVAEHARPAELERLVARWRRRWPALPW